MSTLLFYNEVMKYYYNKAQPHIEYGMVSSRKLNNPRRKPNTEGLVTYYYMSVAEPTSGTYYRNGDYYIIPTKVTPEIYANLVEQDRQEHNNNHKHDRRYLDVEQYYRQKGIIDEEDNESNAWECVANRKTLCIESDLVEGMDKETLIKNLPDEDRIILYAYESGFKQKEIAESIERTQSYVSKRLEQLLERLEYERLYDTSRTVDEIKFEIAWKKFLYSHKMERHIDVIVETFNYLIGERILEEFLAYFYSFGEYYYNAYKVLYLYDDYLEDCAIELIEELPLIFQRIFYYQGLDDQADVFKWLYYCLVEEMKRRRKITPEPNQATYEKLISEQEKIAKRVKMTSAQFAEKRFIPKVAPLIQKRNDEFLEAMNVFVVDENTDVEATLKKLMKKNK